MADIHNARTIGIWLTFLLFCVKVSSIMVVNIIELIIIISFKEF